MAKMWFSVGGSSGLSWNDFLDVAKACDDLGFYGFYPSDHLGPVGRGGPSARLDAMTVLAALSALTRRLRLGALVMGNHFRHPVMTAKIVGALDHVSGGRAELGLGQGGNKEEHVNHGMAHPPFKERLEHLDEGLQVIRALWTQDKATFAGKHYRLDGVEYEPKPVQKPYPPIIVGGSGMGTMRIAARHADEWNTTEVPLKTQATLVERMKELCAEEGRDFSTLRLSHQLTMQLLDKPEAERFLERQVEQASRNPRFKLHPEYTSIEDQVRDTVIVGGPEEMKEAVGKWLAAGVTHLNIHTPRPFERRLLEGIAAVVMPAFG